MGNAVIVVLRTGPRGEARGAPGEPCEIDGLIRADLGGNVWLPNGAGTACEQRRIARFPSFPLRAKFLESPALSGTRHPQARIFLERSFFF
ncbi:hypothetical protein CBM2587_A110078 [Cupriavidus taiwanensis]|uniref:Uncharacterized protein n=1 Tax=Cupriavidus taiwanensis TaxID=164546 RepID=A0A975ZXU1_9BURK|nr:hypothetical protein CBM2587_A110078 [Cupriavidus taiwanensis]